MAKLGSLHRSESRVVRPFASSNLLEATELSLNDETHPYESGELVDWSKIEEIGEGLSPSIRIPPLPDNFAEIVKCSLDELSLVVWLSDPSLKVHQAVHRFETNQWPTQRIDIPKKSVDSLSWSPNCMVGISLVLARSRTESRDGSANRAGQWLSQKVFRISSEDVGTQLPIAYVEDEVFAEKEYPRDTIYVIEFEDGASLNEPMEVGGTLPFMIYFSSSVLARLLNPNAPAAKSLAAQFNSYAVTEILRKGVDELEGEDVAPNSPLDRFLGLTSKHTGLPTQDIVKMIQNGKIEQIRCRIQSGLDLRGALIGSLT